MKRSYFAGCIALMAGALTACSPKADSYTIDSRIGGLKDGTIVKLISLEGDDHDELATDTIVNGAFHFEGVCDTVTYCQVSIYGEKQDEDGQKYSAITRTDLMLENAKFLIECADVDSVPLSWDMHHSPVEKEHNVTVTGGKAQQEFNEYRQAMMDAEIATWNAENEWRRLRYFTKDAPADSIAYFDSLYVAAEALQNQKADAFVEAHPTYSISVYLLQKKAENLFAYTADELDAFAAKAAATPDTCRYAKLQRTVADNKAFAKGVSFKPFSATTEQGDTVLFDQTMVKPGVYTLIDFWASWCGPCRMAIPHVKTLKEYYKDRLTVYSVSLDNSDADWRKAVAEEAMPWPQFVADKAQKDVLRSEYRITAIPFLLVINPQGRIECGTFDANIVNRVLADGIGE